MKKENKRSVQHILNKDVESLKKRTRKKKMLSAKNNSQVLEQKNIELELKIQELITANSRVLEDAYQYSDFFDSSPSSCFTLSKEGRILRANVSGAKLLDLKPSAIKDLKFDSILSKESKPTFKKFLTKVFRTKVRETCDVTLLSDGNLTIYIQLSGIVARNGEFCQISATDVSERKFQIEEREVVSRLMNVVNSQNNFRESISELTASLQNWSGCEAVGIRLREGDDYPYFESRGLPSSFIQTENYLCSYLDDGTIVRDQIGNPVLECMCGNILCGRFDPIKPFFSANGSFWSNSTTALLASTTEAEFLSRTRNRCNGEGYESVALIPLRYVNQVFGLIQFNDHRINRFTPYLISRFERIADDMAIALSRRKIEEALSESAEKYRLLFENMISGFQVNEVILDENKNPIDFRFLDGNSQMMNFTGLSIDEVRGKTIKEIMPSVDINMIRKYCNVGLSGEPFSFEYYSLTYNKYFRVNAYSHKKGQFAVIYDDITERKQAEEKLRIASHYSRSLIEASLDPLVTIDASGKITDVNSATESATGLSRETLIGTDFSNYFTDPDKAKDGYQQVFDLGYVVDYPLTLQHISGKKIDVLYNASVYKNEYGETLGVFAAARDITARKQVEEKLIANESLLRELNADKDRFMSILAHDLRSPFNSLLGLSELMVNNVHKYDIAKIESLSNHINKTAHSTFNLLDNLLMWTRSQSGKIQFNPQKVSLTSICIEILEIFKPVATEKSVTMSFFEANEIWVFADVDMVKTILRNLVSNAIKFSRVNGRINVYAEEENSTITITVSDHGLGIAPEVAKKLFDGSKVTTTKGTMNETGTGLGLLLCKDFVLKNQGRIWVESEKGKGSDFKFTLPVHG